MEKILIESENKFCYFLENMEDGVTLTYFKIITYSNFSRMYMNTRF